MTQPKPLRTTMPTVAAFVDDLRAAFGAETINDAIRNGVQGGTDFYAKENGQTVGHRRPPAPSLDATQFVRLGKSRKVGD